MQPLISIVMPVYNVAGYLEKAIGSVVGQTETDWELILVDDASPDRSGAICDVVAQDDARISVIHLPENGGLSRARNAGMTAAKGRYIMFMDSDDWVEEDLLARLKAAVGQENPPQMIVWGLIEEHFDAEGKQIEKRQVCCTDEDLKDTASVRACALKLEQATLLGYAWNKLYDMELIRTHGAAFEATPLIEDILFNLQILPHVERMQVLSIAPYHYARRTAGSLTHRFLPYYYPLSMRRVEEMLRLYESWGMKEQAARTLAPIFARYVLSALQRNCDPRAEMSHVARKKFVREMLDSGLYRELAPCLGQGKGLGALPGRLLAMRNATACLTAGRAVYIINTKAKTLFVRLSGQRREGE